MALPSLTSLTDSVDAFNSVSLDKSKTMFRDCLGTEFPFDVIDAVDNYARKLSDALNSSLDDVLCDNAIPGMGNSTQMLINDVTNSASSAGDALAPFTDWSDITSGDSSSNVVDEASEEKYAVSHTISFNDFICDYSASETTASGGTYTIKKSSSQFSNLGADEVTISLTPYYKVTESGSNKNIEVTVNGYVDVVNLQRGPNDAEKNLFKPLSGRFNFNKRFSGSYAASEAPTFVPLDSEEVYYSASSKITLGIQANVYNLDLSKLATNEVVKDFVLTLGPLKFNNTWCDIDKSGSDEDDYSGFKSNSAKQKALNALRSEVMSSSLLDEAMDDQLNLLTDSNPALAGMDKDNIKYAVKDSISNNAIALANGDPINVDNTIAMTIASEATASSVNSGLNKLGIDADISADCTKELLGKVIGLLPDASFDNPFGGMTDFIGFEDSYNFANGVVGKLVDKFDKLLSADCIKAVNDSFDICDSELASATGTGVDLAKAGIRRSGL